jgi:hypothetical protein
MRYIPPPKNVFLRSSHRTPPPPNQLFSFFAFLPLQYLHYFPHSSFFVFRRLHHLFNQLTSVDKKIIFLNRIRSFKLFRIPALDPTQKLGKRNTESCSPLLGILSSFTSLPHLPPPTNLMDFSGPDASGVHPGPAGYLVEFHHLLPPSPTFLPPLT